MAQPSPSEFLTFYRAFRSTSTFKHAPRCLARPSTRTTRPFTTTLQRHKLPGEGKDIGPGKDHTLDKAVSGDHRTNVQSDQSKQGRDHRQADTGGHATQQRDTLGTTEKVHKENPKAPKPVIGMQDERGGKGV